jgi:hypothetical protein
MNTTYGLKEKVEQAILAGMPFLSPVKLDEATLKLVLIAAQNKIPDLIRAEQREKVKDAIMDATREELITAVNKLNGYEE